MRRFLPRPYCSSRIPTLAGILSIAMLCLGLGIVLTLPAAWPAPYSASGGSADTASRETASPATSPADGSLVSCPVFRLSDTPD